jgi:hypothetical protein
MQKKSLPSIEFVNILNKTDLLSCHKSKESKSVKFKDKDNRKKVLNYLSQVKSIIKRLEIDIKDENMINHIINSIKKIIKEKN